MGRRAGVIAGCFFLLASPAVGLADLSFVFGEADAVRCQYARALPVEDVRSPPREGGVPCRWAEPPSRLPLPALPPAKEQTSAVRAMPAGPPSASLFLAALAAVGGWRLLQTGRGLHAAAVPYWFHTGAPDRIGRTELVCLYGTNFGPIQPLPLHEPSNGSPGLSYISAAGVRGTAPDAWRFLTEVRRHAPPPAAA